MSYCAWRDTLSDGDKFAVKRLYGGHAQHLYSGDFVGVRVGDKYFDVNTRGTLVYNERLDRAFVVERVSGSGSLRYGDKVRLRHGGEMLCSTMGTGTAQGTVQPLLVWSTRSYHADACVWTLEHVEGTVGGNSVDVADPVKLRLKAPGGTSSSMHADIPYDGAINVRFLGAFPPL